MTEPNPFVAEVLRINDRYVTEVVEARNVCPFARSARHAGKTAREVMLQADLDPAPTIAFIARLEADARTIEVVQVIYPRITVSSREFEHFNAAVRDGFAASVKHRPLFVHAAFHPGFRCDRRTADALVSFFRKAPDPMIQLVRFATLEAVKKDHQPSRGTVVYDPATFDLSKLSAPVLSVSERITRDNHARVEREGPEALEAIYADIREDRARAYAIVDR